MKRFLSRLQPWPLSLKTRGGPGAGAFREHHHKTARRWTPPGFPPPPHRTRRCPCGAWRRPITATPPESGREPLRFFSRWTENSIYVDCATGAIELNGEAQTGMTASFAQGVTFVPVGCSIIWRATPPRSETADRHRHPSREADNWPARSSPR